MRKLAKYRFLKASLAILTTNLNLTSSFNFTPEEAINHYCQESSDPIQCNGDMTHPGAKDHVQECLKSEDVLELKMCLEAVQDFEERLGDDYDWAPHDFVTNEFLEGINEDPMLQNVLSELNGLTGFLSAIEMLEFDENGELNEGSLRSLGDDMPPASQILEAQETYGQLKRFVELKQLVAWLQPQDKRISRYCFYGCWCLPEGAHSFVSGEGRPVDLVDKACQYLWFCYTCAKQEFVWQQANPPRTWNCVPDKQKYSFKFIYDKANKNRYDTRDIRCRDKFYYPMDMRSKWRSNCARAVCECDRGLAKRLYHSWRHWDRSRHRIWSQRVTSCKQLDDCQLLPETTQQEKDEKTACIKRGCLFIVKRRCLNGQGGQYQGQNLICCGKYTDNGSRFEMRNHGGTHDCCDHDNGSGYDDGFPWHGTWFNVITHCCHNGEVLSAAGQTCQNQNG